MTGLSGYQRCLAMVGADRANASQILDAALASVNPAEKSLEVGQSSAFFIPDVLESRAAHDIFDRIQAVFIQQPSCLRGRRLTDH